MQVVKALALECVRNKMWNEAFIAALKELGAEVEIPVEHGAKFNEPITLSGAMAGDVTASSVEANVPDPSVGIGINPASALPQGADLIGVECYVWGDCRSPNGSPEPFGSRSAGRASTAIITHYDPAAAGYSWGTTTSWFDHAVPVWFGDPADFEEVTEGRMIEGLHQFRSGALWETVRGLDGHPIDSIDHRYIVRRRCDGRSF